jgi:hypothetical protein
MHQIQQEIYKGLYSFSWLLLQKWKRSARSLNIKQMPVNQLRCNKNSWEEINENSHGNHLYEFEAVQECDWML